MHRPMTPVVAPSGGGGGGGGSNSNAGSRPTSARTASRPVSASHQRRASVNAAGAGSGGGSSGALFASSANNTSPRWITTGSHVLDREAALKAQTKPRPPGGAPKRSDEEIERFFRNLNSKTVAQRNKLKELREKYLAGTEEPAKFATAEDQEASVSRLYFDAIQHKEQTYADLEEMYAPGNPCKVVEPAVIGETVERLFANNSPTAASRQDRGGRASSEGGRSDGGNNKGSKKNGGKKDDGSQNNDGEFKAKKITPQEEKDAVQRLYYLSLEFRKRREKELVEKHLFHGYKSPSKVDTSAVVERLYAGCGNSNKKQ